MKCYDCSSARAWKAARPDGSKNGRSYPPPQHQKTFLSILEHLLDPLASREHASLQMEAGRWVLTDLNSANGTFVNGKRITRYALQEGDCIQIGSVVILFEDRKVNRPD